MTLRYDLYWSFRSPYSYMVTPRLLALEADYDVVCDVRPVYPLAVRTPEFFENRDPLWTSYLIADVFREAAFLGLPFRWPRPDPVQQAPGAIRRCCPGAGRTELSHPAFSTMRGASQSGFWPTTMSRPDHDRSFRPPVFALAKVHGPGISTVSPDGEGLQAYAGARGGDGFP